MRGTALALLAVASSMGSPGCRRPRRVPNQAVLLAVEVARTSASGPAETDAQTVGGAHVMAQVADTNRDWVSARGRADVGLGGNGKGWAGHLTLDAQLGLALWDASDHLFGRVGLFGTLERDPATGLYALDFPTLWLGYQHHGREAADPLHLDIGPRVSLGLAGRVFAPGATADYALAPGTGGAALVMWQFVAFELVYMHVFEGSSLDIVRGSACVAAFVALCVDTRHVWAEFDGARGATAYYGVRFGAGLAEGRSPPL